MSLERLISRKVLFITGKGGIGKTLVATAIGMLAAQEGKRVCLIESTFQDQVPPLFGLRPHGHYLKEVSAGLSSINLNASDNFRDFVVKHIGNERLFKKVFEQGIVKSFVNALPGIAELTLLGRVYYTSYMAPEDFDLVIFDGYSSGHFLNLMTTPAAIVESGLVGPVLKETQKVIDYMNAPGNSAVLFVTTMESLVLTEVRDFVPKLNDSGLSRVEGLLVNRCVAEDDLSETLGKLPNEEMKRYVESKYLVDGSPLADLGCDVDTMLRLPELGAVSEPLSSQFARQFLCESVDG